MNSTRPKLGARPSPSERRQAQSELMSRTSENPHRPRLASSPSPLHRGTFGHRQNNKQPSPQGLTQTPLAPAGEETKGDLASTRALTRARPERAPQAQSEPRGLGRPSCRPLGSERHARSDPKTSIAGRRYKYEEPHLQQQEPELHPPRPPQRLRATRSKPASIETPIRIFHSTVWRRSRCGWVWGVRRGRLRGGRGAGRRRARTCCLRMPS